MMQTNSNHKTYQISFAAIKAFVLSKAFIIGLVVGCVLGIGISALLGIAGTVLTIIATIILTIPATVYTTLAVDSHKKKQRRKQDIFKYEVEDGNINLEYRSEATQEKLGAMTEFTKRLTMPETSSSSKTVVVKQL